MVHLFIQNATANNHNFRGQQFCAQILHNNFSNIEDFI